MCVHGEYLAVYVRREYIPPREYGAVFVEREYVAVYVEMGILLCVERECITVCVDCAYLAVCLERGNILPRMQSACAAA